MGTFVRKNELVCTGIFTPAPGQVGTPTSAELVLDYTNTSDVKTTEQIQMTVGTDGTWYALWDSSNCKGGSVEWMVHCWGGLVAATEGTFHIKANRANRV